MVLKALGTAALGLGANVLGGVASSFLGRKDYDHRIDKLRGLGLTPQEIAGSGASGGGPLGSYASLGNAGTAAIAAGQQTEKLKLAKDQQKIDVYKAELDAGVKRQQIRAGIDIARGKLGVDTGHLSIAQGKAPHDVSLTKARIRQSNEQTWGARQKRLQDKVNNDPERLLLFKMASMSAENMSATALYGAFKQLGIDLIDPRGGGTPEQKVSAVRLVKILGSRSKVADEIFGIAHSIKELSDNALVDKSRGFADFLRNRADKLTAEALLSWFRRNFAGERVLPKPAVSPVRPGGRRRRGDRVDPGAGHHPPTMRR